MEGMAMGRDGSTGEIRMGHVAELSHANGGDGQKEWKTAFSGE